MTQEMRIAEAVRVARAREGITQAELARRVGCDQSQISRIEQSGRNITVTQLAALVRALDLDPAPLFETGEQPDDNHPELA